MSGRTCQLCGKALSRFSVGSGGDFCSREHRNQFRLRSGMDRLMEANKVASLMRRRENAKAIPSAQLARDYQVMPRVAPVLQIALRPPNVQPLHALQAILETPRMAAQTRNLLIAHRAAASMDGKVRSFETGGFQVWRRPMLPPRSQRFPTQIVPAGIVLPRLNSASMAELRREANELRLHLQRTHIGGNGIQVKPLQMALRTCREPQKPRRLNNSADRGRELRVSGGIGFRLVKPRLRPLKFARPSTAKPAGSGRPSPLHIPSQPVKSTVTTAGVVRFTVRVPSPPNGPKPTRTNALRWPGVRIGGPELPRQSTPIARSCGVKWIAPEANAPQFRYRNGVARLRPPAPSSPSLPPPPPRSLQPAQRLTLVEFRPQAIPFECPTALHGTLLGGTHLGAPPVRKMETAPAALEEHFDAGLHHWMGGVADWKVDVAGVRAGSLALYSPSLDLANYTLEFLTRIESRSVTWVFRATSLNEYYQATLSVLPGGGYELRRCAVMAGAAQDATVRSAPAPATSGKTAVTVRTRVMGSEFAVSVDGQAIDTWTDTRLAAGGIGFVGAPEERTRLYWVKVTPTGHLSKEYLKR
jgi:hypothetical protein